MASSKFANEASSAVAIVEPDLPPFPSPSPPLSNDPGGALPEFARDLEGAGGGGGCSNGAAWPVVACLCPAFEIAASVALLEEVVLVPSEEAPLEDPSAGSGLIITFFMA